MDMMIPGIDCSDFVVAVVQSDTFIGVFTLLASTWLGLLVEKILFTYKKSAVTSEAWDRYWVCF